MNVAIAIPLVTAAIFLSVCIVIAIIGNAEDRKWTYKGQYIKKRAKSLLNERWLHCRQKPLGVIFCGDCAKRDECLAECKEEIEKFIDKEGVNDENE